MCLLCTTKEKVNERKENASVKILVDVTFSVSEILTLHYTLIRLSDWLSILEVKTLTSMDHKTTANLFFEQVDRVRPLLNILNKLRNEQLTYITCVHCVVVPLWIANR